MNREITVAMSKLSQREFEVMGVIKSKPVKGSYGFEIADELEEKLDQRPNIGAIYTMLKRLEQKGFLETYEGPANKNGRKITFYRITGAGQKAFADFYDRSQKALDAFPLPEVAR
jgi:PadR family transcriptional regulator PadR